ncbi:sigma factor regulatory protein, FecR/PupR family [Proteiniphilum saccharofermentans]|uniref:Sigma factor regulatory protein, FecR/PupR family n=1 Tax=Proteiniphilum saccharofermentans TaxID=1642647 RepID=A0A1R3T3Q5_9BACT|nr:MULTISPECIES: FecR domain-containing protein [Proteiniphilum]MDY9919381.1 FecR domain-containing protein [Proteiniphilum sp.]SCD19908.1 sigma factor regulatory protein, FecR/PupR family [Proteiniphilum saccharofermentans]SFK40519.1 ferric-dicitrate binding protein FerR, regulates iron transport through sigma-19 [Porphyromonadaceae bacterium KH3CP3RA]
MNKDLLYRFFEGNTTLEEEKQIRQWIDTSEENRITFLQERKIYDAILFRSPGISNTNRKRRTIGYHIGAIAASLFILIASALYLHTLRQENNSLDYNTLVVPAGQRIHLILADNTDIWLNANSTLRYPTEFSRKDRTVYLDGEAFFEVSKDDKKPFMVKTTSGDIKVTGTSFNVEAYSKHGGFETSLFEGSVEIYKNDHKLTTLKPDERSYLKDGKLYVTPITDMDKYLWKDGLIAFNNKRLEDILQSLEKYFDIRIQISNSSLPQRTYTGKFRQSDGVDYALRVLQKSIHFSYQRDETTGIVYIK